MKNIKLLFTLVLMTITVLATSCSDWLDNISPRHAIPQSALTDDDLEKLLNGVYATMENYTFTFWWLDDIQGENFKAGPGGGQITSCLITGFLKRSLLLLFLLLLFPCPLAWPP